MLDLPQADFEALVAEALDEIPPELTALLDNVVFVVEDRHPEEPHLPGLYHGVPLTERGATYADEDHRCHAVGRPFSGYPASLGESASLAAHPGRVCPDLVRLPVRKPRAGLSRRDVPR